MTRYEFTPTQRRDFLAGIAKSTLGVSFAGGLAFGRKDTAFAADAVASGKAKHVIYLFMEGAMSHLDTFDPKVGVEEAGSTKAIPTRIPGVSFGDQFEKLAYLAGGLAVVRSLTTETGDHEKGRYLMRTSYKKLNSIQHPGMGAWMVDQKGRQNPQLPANYVIGSAGRHPGAGFLPPSISPVPIAKAENGIQNISLPKYLPPELFGRRLSLASKFDESFQKTNRSSKIEAYNQLYGEARQLMGSRFLDVFDLKKEKDSVRDAYGRNGFGQGCLLARRLVKAGARFVEVTSGGWDMHQDLPTRIREKGPELDTAVSSLLRDLHAQGLLKETLVVLTTEFGRKPKVNANDGRDHHPGVFCSLLAGAGVQTGGVYGASDSTGHSVDESMVSVADFNKTIATAAGLPTEQEFFAPNGRPFKIGGDGEAIEDLLA